jgi:hypothetical protein
MADFDGSTSQIVGLSSLAFLHVAAEREPAKFALNGGNIMRDCAAANVDHVIALR